MAADLDTGSCPVCRAVGRETARFLGWLAAGWPEAGPSGMDLMLCPRHLHDAWTIDGLGPALTAVRATAARRQVVALAAAAKTITSKGHRWSPLRGSAASHVPGRMSPAAAYEGAVSELVNDTYCRGCRVAETAEQRQIALLGACVDDARVADALAVGHGPCLRHVAALAASPAGRPVLLHLATRLREVQWDVAENVRKQAWDARYEPIGTEQTVWRRVPMLLDGEVYLGVAETEAWSPGPSSDLDAQAPRRR